jgi:hypothetical protein
MAGTAHDTSPFRAPSGSDVVKIGVGYELIYDCPQQTSMVLMVNIHHTRVADIILPDPVTARGRDATDVAITRASGLRRHTGATCEAHVEAEFAGMRLR